MSEEIENEFANIINTLYLQGFIKDVDGRTSNALKAMRKLYNQQKQELEKNKDLDDYFISKDKIKNMLLQREFELQQEYKEFENDGEWKAYKKILGED